MALDISPEELKKIESANEELFLGIILEDQSVRLQRADWTTFKGHAEWLASEPRQDVIRGFSLGVESGLVAGIYRGSTVNPTPFGRLEDEYFWQLLKLLPLSEEFEAFDWMNVESAKMTYGEAVTTLKNGGSLARLAKAIGTVASDPASSTDDIMLGLSFPGFIQEQAALALYRRIGESLPQDRGQMIVDAHEWKKKLEDSSSSDIDRDQFVDWFELANAAYKGAAVACHGDFSEANGIASEALLEVQEQIRSGRLQGMMLRKPDELVRRAYSVSKNLLRKRQDQQLREQHSDAFAARGSYQNKGFADADETAEFDAAVAQLQKAIGQLPATEASIVMGYYVEGATMSELADRLSISRTTVSGRLRHAIKLLESNLG